MGKGNVCVRGEYEGLYYIDLSNFTDKYINEDGEEVINYDLQQNIKIHLSNSSVILQPDLSLSTHVINGSVGQSMLYSKIHYSTS